MAKKGLVEILGCWGGFRGMHAGSAERLRVRVQRHKSSLSKAFELLGGRLLQVVLGVRECRLHGCWERSQCLHALAYDVVDGDMPLLMMLASQAVGTMAWL